ncbi:MAG TPA: MFS transporter [Gaiellaceae bacterium]
MDEAVPSPRRWWSLGALAFSLFMIYLDTTVVNVALPAIQADLGIGLSQLEWVVNAYTLPFAVLLLTGGKLADFLGRRRVFLAGLTVFTASSLACGLAHSGAGLIAARAVQGSGAALMLPATLSIISVSFQPRERGTALGVWAASSGIGAALGPLVGGALVEGASWRWIFYVNVPVGLIGLVAGRVLVDESRDDSAEQRLDLPGLLTSGIGLLALVYALVEGNRYGWASGRIIASFAVAAAGLILFVAVEARSRLPMLELGLFRRAAFAGANVVGLVSFFALFGVFFFVSIYMQRILGYSALETGLAFLPFSMLVALTVPLAGRATDRFGARWPLATGMASLGAGLLLQSRLGLEAAYWELLPGFVLGGIGIGLTIAPANAAVLGSAPDAKAGVASAVVNTFRQTGGALGVAVMGAVVGNRIGSLRIGDPRLAVAFVDGLQDALRFGAVAALAGAVVAALAVRSAPGQAPAELAV